MYELYYGAGACSMAIHVILNETGQAVNLKKINMMEGEHKTPAFLKMNPQGAVPVLLEDGKPLLEGAAQIIYLCDTHKSALLPQAGWERAQALQWLMFANATLHPAYARGFWLMKRATFENPSEKDNLLKQACAAIQGLWDNVEAHLARTGKPYLAGDAVTAGDILLTVIANWGALPQAFTFGPKTQNLLKSIVARPAYQKALAAEGVEYKAVA